MCKFKNKCFVSVTIKGPFTPCLNVQMISMSTWFQAITWVISMILKVYDIVDVLSLKNCQNDRRRFVKKKSQSITAKTTFLIHL